MPGLLLFNASLKVSQEAMTSENQFLLSDLGEVKGQAMVVSEQSETQTTDTGYTHRVEPQRGPTARPLYGPVTSRGDF